MSPVSDPIARLGIACALVLVVAKVGGHLAMRFKQPSVLGELLGGILLGSLPLPLLVTLRDDPSMDLLARLGVLVLLFQVGLESTVRDILRVGIAAAAVAVLGTLGSLGAGWAAAALTLPHESAGLHWFLAASLTATSVGISARVLKDADASRTAEARTILGAAMIDDVLGLVVLAIASGAMRHSTEAGAFAPLAVAWLLTKTFGFLLVALVVGIVVSPVLFRFASRLQSDGVLVATGLSFCFVMAWVSAAIGLAPIVGAFAAGLVLEDSHSGRFVARGERSLGEQMEPIGSWLVPIFFVLMGMRADLSAFASGPRLLLVASLTLAAIAGKLLCAAGAPRGSDRVAVALGMLPRGEVSLVFASLGLTLGLLDGGNYAVLVTVVVLTTLVTPAALRWRLSRRDASHAHDGA